MRVHLYEIDPRMHADGCPCRFVGMCSSGIYCADCGSLLPPVSLDVRDAAAPGPRVVRAAPGESVLFVADDVDEVGA